MNNRLRSAMSNERLTGLSILSIKSGVGTKTKLSRFSTRFSNKRGKKG